MFEEILPGFYRIELQLPKGPLKTLNSYLIKGGNRFLVIDTGMNHKKCLHIMRSNLETLGVDLNNTDFFITHLHADHLGLVGNLATESSKVYLNEVEASIANSVIRNPEERVQKSMSLYLAHGFPKNEFKKAMESHPALLYTPKRQIDFYVMKEGNNINIGDYSFQCIETPGHSPGHMCLYEEKEKILVSGDHILFDITPNITYWFELKNALKHYLASLEKVYALDVDLVLPGHRSILSDHRRRINELREHHENRLHEVLSALKKGGKTGWEVSPFMTWDMDISSWELFPPAQKLFAIGETIAHLDYLELDKKVSKEIANNKIVYSLQ